jgi:hypothetical protein
MRPGARLAAAGCAAALALACLPASAQDLTGRAFYSGNDMWSLCASNDAFEAGLCRGFVVGVADVMGLRTAILGSGTACIPLPVNAGQATDVAKRFLEQHPESRHQAAAGLVAAALALAFPCPP